jgi:hypothetical protein
MASEPHISDVTSGNVMICGTCGTANLKDSIYCRECGWRLPGAKIPAYGIDGGLADAGRQGLSSYGDAVRADRQDDARAAAYEAYPASGDVRAVPSAPAEPRKSMLEKLDLMERELEAKKQEAIPEPERGAEPDKLDEHEETLKSIAFRLDALISDLLKAEAQEYAFVDSPRVDEKNFGKNGASAGRGTLKNKVKNSQEMVVMIVLAALIAAIFLVGMTFGLWGSYFFRI